jgi:hypothetical protein
MRLPHPPTPLRSAADTAKTYMLVVDKPGYSQTRTFTYAELKAEFGNEPVPVYLEETLDIYIRSELREHMELELTGSGEITVQWGDTGEPRTSTLPYFYQNSLPSGNYKVRIKGDLDAITEFRAFSYSNGVTSIDGIHYLTTLKSFDPGQYIVSPLSLAYNKLLEFVFIIRPGVITLPREHHIDHIATVYYGPESDSHLDDITENILANAADKGIYHGYFQITVSVDPYTLPPQTQMNLQMLQEEYQWEVNVE